LAARRGAAREIDEAAEEIAELADEGLTWRLTQAAEAKNRAIRAETEDRTEFDTAPSGARISRDEKAAFETLLDQIKGAGTGARRG
jgi:DNA primase